MRYAYVERVPSKQQEILPAFASLCNEMKLKFDQYVIWEVLLFWLLSSKYVQILASRNMSGNTLKELREPF